MDGGKGGASVPVTRSNGGKAGVLCIALLVAAGCGGKSAPTPAPERVTRVEVVRLEPQRVEDWLDLPGTIEPEQAVTVGAEVGGLLEWRGPKEGDRVRAGERLALVDRERLALVERQAALALEQATRSAERARIGVDQARTAAAQAAEQEKKLRAVREKAVADRDRAKALAEEKLAPRSYFEGFETAVTAADADLATAAGSVQAAAAAIESAVADYAGARSRIESAAAALEEARLWVRKSEVLSPIDGSVSIAFHEQGEIVEANKPLFTLVATARVKAVFPLPERDVALFAKGAAAAVTVASLAPEPIVGRVSLVGVAADPATSTYRMEVDLPNADGRLKAGMLAKLRILRHFVEGTVTVPLFSVMRGDGGMHAFVYDNGVARRREVTAGIVDGERQQILGGLAPGDLLIVKGQRELEDGQKVSLP
jgi:multidrug efflux pump subunit AcrA (membrane-fusion protein)